MIKLSSRQSTGVFQRLVVTLIILIHVSFCAWGAWCHSPTMDEPAYLASGISHWQFGRFDLCRVSPPLVRLVASIPVQLTNAKYDWSHYTISPGARYEHDVGRDFLIANGDQSFWLFTLGRWACIPFSLFGALVCYSWAKQLFGIPSALIALLLWCFSPNILAHAQQLTPDIGVTALSLSASYAFWYWAQKPSKLRVSIAGGILGLAVLAKTNAVVLYPALVTGVLIHFWVTKRCRWWQATGQILIAFLISIYIINLGYGFEGSFKPLGKYRFFSNTLGTPEGSNRFADNVAGIIPIPFPAAFLEGIDLQRRDFENNDTSKRTYFRGKWYDHGWWWYYFYVVAVKVPVGIWILFFAGCLMLVFRTMPHRVDSFCYLTIPGAALFALACSQTGFGHSLRYVLPAFPFAFLLASAALCETSSRSTKMIAYTALGWFLISSLYIYPHSLSYFNEFAGGPKHGHYHLLDGNLDWGQDLLFIKDWIAENPDKTPLHVAYWGCLPLKQMGMKVNVRSFQTSKNISSGWYLVSVNYLRQEHYEKRPVLVQFLDHEPKEIISYSTYIYYIP